MGLRVEQHNLEDLLKYFVARNEFKRKNVVEILKDLTDDERSKMNITNYAEFYSSYKFLYKLLKEDLIKGASTTIKNDKELSAKSRYERDFLLTFPFYYILDQRIANDTTKSYRFVYDDFNDDNNPYWVYVYDKDAVFNETYQFNVYESEKVNLKDFGIVLNGIPKVGDFITVNYVASNPRLNNSEEISLVINKGFSLNSELSTVNVSDFGKKAKTYSVCYYTEKDDIDTLFQKIVDSNPEIHDIYSNPILISSKFDVENNRDDKIKLNDIFTFTDDIYYRSDKDEEGYTKLTKYTIILAALRKILDDRSVKYNIPDYLVDIVKDKYDNIKSFDLKYEILLGFVLDTNPMSKEELVETGDYSFRNLKSEIASLKTYVNDYVVNNTVNYENKYFMKKGKANYSGFGHFTTIPHNTGLQPMGTIINNVNPDDTKHIGDVYIKSDNKNIYIYNTGSNCSEFEFTTFFDSGDFVEFPIKLSFEEFVKICINGIKKIKLEKSNQTTNTSFILDDGNNGSFYNEFEFLIVNDNEGNEKYYRIGDKDLFDYYNDDKRLVVKSDDIKITDNDDYYITSMSIEEDPILYLLNNLMNNPNFHIQKIQDLKELIFEPTLKDFETYKREILSVSKETIDKIMENKDKYKFIDLSEYGAAQNDILFINGLAFSLTDEDYFMLLNYTDDKNKERSILIILDISLDDKDVLHISRISKYNEYDIDGAGANDDGIYNFSKYVYLNSKSSFGRMKFKSDVLLGDGHAEDKSSIKLDPSTRLFNRDPLTNRIEEFKTYGEYLNEVGVNDVSDTIRIRNQSRFAVVPHKLGIVPNFVIINPYTNDSSIDDDEAKVGNIWWDADETNIYVYNSGESECQFEWTAFYDEECNVDTNVYGDSENFNINGYLFYNIVHNSDNKLDYVGNDYVTYDKTRKQLVGHNTNTGNYGNYKLHYINRSTNIINPKFLEYAENFTYNQDGYFDRNEDSMPTGDRVLNYSGEFRATRGRFYGGDGIVQYFPADPDQKFEHGDIVSYVNGVCKLADITNFRTAIGVVCYDHSLCVDCYNKYKVPVAMYGVHDVKVAGHIVAGEYVGLMFDNDDVGAISSEADNEGCSVCCIGKALQDSKDETGIIKILLEF